MQTIQFLQAVRSYSQFTFHPGSMQTRGDVLEIDMCVCVYIPPWFNADLPRLPHKHIYYHIVYIPPWFNADYLLSQL